jgi:predicted nucleic acid-binding protein
MMATLETQGKTMPVIDSLIFATAQHHNMTLVTRNTKDFVNA